MAGLNNRCLADEAMLQAIIKSTPGANRMYIVDTRPKVMIWLVFHFQILIVIIKDKYR